MVLEHVKINVWQGLNANKPPSFVPDISVSFLSFLSVLSPAKRSFLSFCRGKKIFGKNLRSKSRFVFIRLHRHLTCVGLNVAIIQARISSNLQNSRND